MDHAIYWAKRVNRSTYNKKDGDCWKLPLRVENVHRYALQRSFMFPLMHGIFVVEGDKKVVASPEMSTGPRGETGSGHGPNWDYNWRWASTPNGGWGYGSGSGRSSNGFGRGFGYGSGSGTGSGSGYGYGSGSVGAHGGGYGAGSGSGNSAGGGSGSSRGSGGSSGHWTHSSYSGQRTNHGHQQKIGMERESASIRIKRDEALQQQME
ncbi:unnamed protein product [Dovyalis caffra]|uniref:Uncharacterized protein n=1 Tax=Dovyalis caffra TaxID=77055 RepID=A0AAV1R4X4_9ROSI|nr:unnamed protein product [Dovyalis caffra]